MRTFETHIQVTPDGQVVVEPVPDLPAGEYDAVLVIQPMQQKTARQRLNFPVDDLGAWPEGLSLRREDFYGDNER